MMGARWASASVLAAALVVAIGLSGCGKLGRGKGPAAAAEAPGQAADVGVPMQKAEGTIKSPAAEGAPAAPPGARSPAPAPARPGSPPPVVGSPPAGGRTPPAVAAARREPAPASPAAVPAAPKAAAYLLLLRGVDARRLPEIAELQKRYANTFTFEVAREGQASEVRVRFDDRSTESVKALLDLLARPR
jgi:hypothetical protein